MIYTGHKKCHPPILAKQQSSSLLVEVNGVEPMASCVQGRRSPS